MTNAEIIAEIRKLSVELNGDTESLPALSKLRKPALEQLLSGLRLNLQSRKASELVAEHGSDEAKAAWDLADRLDRDESANAPLQDDTVEARAAADPQARELAERMGLIETGDDTEALIAEVEADAELTSFMRTVVNAPRLPDPLPITETDVADAKVDVIVQSGSKLIWGKLIAVVNRRTKYLPPFLVTVEIDGHRKLVAADDVLAA